MIKTFQWIYQMGVKHERLRIKKLAAELSQEINNDNREHINSHLNPYNRPDADPSLRKNQLDTEQLVNDRAMQVLDRMIYPQPPQQYAVQEFVPPLIDGDK